MEIANKLNKNQLNDVQVILQRENAFYDLESNNYKAAIEKLEIAQILDDSIKERISNNIIKTDISYLLGYCYMKLKDMSWPKHI